MKIFWRKYSDVIVINLLALFIVIILFYFFKVKTEILAAIMVTGISLSMVLRQYKTENDKLFKELFQEFNAKYDSNYNNTLNKIDLEYNLNRSLTLKQEDTQRIIDYLNFCSEEYLWYHQNRIPEKVWKSWEDGMVYFLNLPPINKIVLDQMKQLTSYYGLWDKIGKRINNWK